MFTNTSSLTICLPAGLNDLPKMDVSSESFKLDSRAKRLGPVNQDGNCDKKLPGAPFDAAR